MARICMVAFTHYSTDTRVRREAEALVDRGDEVDALCLREEGREDIWMLNGVRLHQLPIGRYRGSSVVTYLLRYTLFFLVAALWLNYLHLKKRYQVIQVHTMPDFMVFVALIPRIFGAKVILDVHDLMPELYRSKFGLHESHWLIRFITWMERRSVGFAHGAIAVHGPHLDTLVKHGNPAEKFIILLNLPDPKVFSRRFRSDLSSDGCFRLVYHGTVARRNGLRVALRALPKIKKEIEDLELQIFGEGDDIPCLIDLAEELGLVHCVRISGGMAPMDELVPIILNADVGIVPILYDDFTKYMLPVKLLEYVALGIPVVSSRTETIEAYFDDSMVQYCKPGDADDLAEKILDLHRNPDMRERLRTNADRFNRGYSWEQQKQLYYRLIDDLSERG
jgi:glycosyltransferase involved in cell wall biosynthesis